jgi:hypothetical protein
LEAGTFNADWGLDTSAPAVRATVVDGIGGTGPDYVAPAHVTLDAADEMGGFGDDVIEYSLDGGPWTTYHAPLVLSTEGTYTVSYRAGSANGQVIYGPHEGSGPIRAVNVLRETSATQQLTLRVVGSLPAVVSTSPVDGATRVPVDSSIVMEFSRPMDREATEQAFAINGVTPRFTWSDDGRTLLVTPYRLVRLPWPKVGDRHYLLPLLAAGTTYTVRLNGAVDATGLALPSYAFSFSTAAGDTGGSCGALPDGRGGPAAVLPWLGLLLLLRRRRLNWRLARQPVADRPSRPGRRDR